MSDEPQATNLTGFDNNLDENYVFESQREADELNLMNPALLQTKYTKRTIRVEMEQEKATSQSLAAMLSKIAFSLGSKLLGAVVNQVKEVPGYISSGATLLLTNAKEKVQTLRVDEAQEKFDPSKESILIVMPDEVIQGGVSAQDKWLEEQRDKISSHIHLVAPIEKKLVLQNLNENELQESLVDPIQEPKQQFNQFNLIESEDLTMIPRQVLAISEQSYLQLIEYHKQEQSELQQSLDGRLDQLNQPEVKDYEGMAIQYPTIGRAMSNAIKLYPMLPTFIDKNQINLQVEQMLAQEKLQNQGQEQNQSVLNENENMNSQINPYAEIKSNPYERLDNFQPQFQPIKENQNVKQQVAREQVEELLCE